jgi:hydrogenase maturation protease
MSIPSILVIGVGNILMGDEGVGVFVVRELSNMKLPDNIEVLDAGTAMMDLLDRFWGRKKIIIIDALQVKDEPGAIYKMKLDDLKLAPSFPLSFHQKGLSEVLFMARLQMELPPIVLIGIVPKEIRWRLGISDEIKEKVPQVIEMILGECKH